MNIKEVLSLGLMRLPCSRYSEFDDLVIKRAYDLDMPLIGGTALEILGHYYNKPGFRKRSDNDLDFITNDRTKYIELAAWLRENVDPTKVKVDTMLVRSHTIPEDHILNLGGVFVMSPEYLVWSKVQRFSEVDKKDIQYLIPLCNFDLLESLLEDLGITDEEFDNLNSLIDDLVTEPYNVLPDSYNGFTGCLMVLFDLPFIDDLRSLVDPEDLHEHGFSDDTHVTALYGFSDAIKSVDDLDLDGYYSTPISVAFKGVSFFENEEYDVMKLDVISDKLVKLNKFLVDNYEHKNDYPVFHPHCTIAYLKPGMASKYRALWSSVSESFDLPYIAYSTGFNYTVQV